MDCASEPPGQVDILKCKAKLSEAGRQAVQNRHGNADADREIGLLLMTTCTCKPETSCDRRLGFSTCLSKVKQNLHKDLQDSFRCLLHVAIDDAVSFGSFESLPRN